jgi:DNA-binding MarR family transcriptional regulator
MTDDFASCMVSNTRKAARAVTRRYDAYLRPYGMTATQFSLLGGVGMMPGATVSEIAEERGFDRTTLTRNLDRLEALGLVQSHHPAHGNGRISEVTPAGEALIAKLLPLWRQAQADLEAELSAAGFTDTLGALQRLSSVQPKEPTT